MHFTAIPGTGSRTGWAGTGQADVRVETDGCCLRLHEDGVFQAVDAGEPVGRRIVFGNVFRWDLTDATLALSHERFGRAAAVFLFRLHADGPNRLISRQPHLCGADAYSASALIGQDQLALDWHIRGPHKDEHLHYIYGGPSAGCSASG